jgi:hypothetical protein
MRGRPARRRGLGWPLPGLRAWPGQPRVVAVILDSVYDAFGFIGTTFRELGWKTLIIRERVVPISPNAW